MKQSNNLYDYLEQSGVLQNGSPDEIRMAKQEFWKIRRKEYRKHQRNTCKSCTVFFTTHEYKLITGFFVGKPNVAGFVKQSALNVAQHKMSITKELVGKVRQVF